MSNSDSTFEKELRVSFENGVSIAALVRRAEEHCKGRSDLPLICCLRNALGLGIKDARLLIWAVRDEDHSDEQVEDEFAPIVKTQVLGLEIANSSSTSEEK